MRKPRKTVIATKQPLDWNTHGPKKLAVIKKPAKKAKAESMNDVIKRGLVETSFI